MPRRNRAKVGLTPIPVDEVARRSVVVQNMDSKLATLPQHNQSDGQHEHVQDDVQEHQDGYLEPSVDYLNAERIAEVRIKLMENNLSTRGSDTVLLARWLSFEKKQDAKPGASYYDLHYLVVVDFEATCQEEGRAGSYEQEVIEFPAVLIDVRNRTVVSEFHSFCKPRKNTLISEYCTKLTGIAQETVDAADEFPAVLLRFAEWLRQHGLLQKTKWSIVTDGNFDVKLFLFNSCHISGTPFPCYARMFVNLPKLFHWIYLHGDQTKQRNNLSGMLENLGLQFEGRLHSGIDDARNIARVCLVMIEDGVYLRPTDIVDLGAVDEKRPKCCRTYPVSKRKWEALHKTVMKRLPSVLLR